MRRLSELHPFFYHARIRQKRLFRQLADANPAVRFAAQKESKDLDFTCKRHQSLLRRRLGDSDPQLQENKITNLSIAIPTIDGIVIRPGETFSFWRQVGEATADKGYVEGMQLSRGEVVRGIGGGLCQLANLLFWMTLHTPLKVVERHHHSFDPFPDENRTLPFGSGCGVFYNYIDLRFFNPTETAFQIRLGLTDRHLKGAIYANERTRTMSLSEITAFSARMTVFIGRTRYGARSSIAAPANASVRNCSCATMPRSNTN